MRSILAGAAAAWFIWLAQTFVPPFGVYLNDGQVGGLDGDAGAVAVTYAVRMLSVGLAIIALAVAEWGRLIEAFRGGTAPATPATPSPDGG